MSPNIRQVALFSACALCGLVLVAREMQASDAPMPYAEMIDVQVVSLWMKRQFSAVELEALGPNDMRVESYFCGCYDTPRPHFPYRIVLFITPKGDLVGRPEGQEFGMRITPLAVRKGNRYCEVESEEQCYGDFADPCDFTDFRYGSYLKDFFPSCIADEKQTGLSVH